MSLVFSQLVAAAMGSGPQVVVQAGGQLTIQSGGVMNVGVGMSTGGDAAATASPPPPVLSPPPPAPPPAPPALVNSISISLSKACAYKVSSNEFKCWGSGANGGIGDGTETQRDSPVSVDVGGPVKDICTGEHICAALTDGTLKCWGGNEYGSVGDGGTSNVLSPKTIDVGGEVDQVGCGNYHTCVILTDGTLKCWGLNFKGAVGDGRGPFTSWGAPGMNQLTPKTIDIGGKAKMMALASQHTCVVLADDSTVKCWGTLERPVGDGSDGSTGHKGSPVSVDVGGTVASIKSGDSHTCALLTTGVLRCWGITDNGRTGTTNGLVPDTPAGTESWDIKLLALGWNTCAYLADGKLRCFGHNRFGTGGSGSTDQDAHNTVAKASDVDLGGVPNALAASNYDVCAALADDTFKCWGKNTIGQLGNGKAPENSAVPVTVDW